MKEEKYEREKWKNKKNIAESAKKKKIGDKEEKKWREKLQ